MKSSRATIWTLSAVLACMAATSVAARAQNYPSRTIKILVSTAPGGLLDVLSRILGQKITEATGQAVVIENKTSGNGAVAGGDTAKAAPDGYTLLMGFHGVNAMLPHMTSKLTFDATKDFAAVVHIMTVPNILVTHPSVPAKDVKELIAYAKANPGKLTYASQGVGSSGHVGGEMFKQLAGVDITHVPFRGAAPAAQSLVGGQISMMFDNVTLASESIKAGSIRALGVASKERSSALPWVPTLMEQGVQLEISAWFGLIAPAGTPPSVIAWLNQEANKAFSAPEVRARYVGQGAVLPLGTPEAFETFIAAEYKKWGPIITRANIRID